MKRNKTKNLTTNNSIANITQIGEKMTKVQTDVKPDYKQEEVPVYTDTALGIFRSPGKGWFVAKIRYNPETEQVSTKLEKIHAGDDRILANERFKVTAINEKVVV